MADVPVGEVIAVEAALDALDAPTASEVYDALQPYSNDAGIAVAASLALAGGGGGGSQPIAVVRVPIAFDDVGIGPTLFAITAVTPGAGTSSLTVSGNHAAAFPAGSAVRITGSSGNDGTLTSAGAVFGAATVISLVEELSDPTADGDVVDPSAGVAIYMPEAGETVIAGWVSLPPATAWDGDNPQLHIGMRGAELDAPFGGPFDISNNVNGVIYGGAAQWVGVPSILLTGAGPPAPVQLDTATPILAMVDNGAFVDPGSAQGEGKIVLVIAAAA